MRVQDIARALTIGAAALLLLSGCGGGGGGEEGSPMTAPAAQQPCANPSDCGDVIVALTDADGDFLSYTVDVQSLTLRRADGTTVTALPVTTRIDFAQVVELTEFLTAATVPKGAYVEGTLRLDYSSAEVTVESNGQPVAAQVVGADGSPLGAVDVRVVLDNRNHLTVAPGRPALLSLDFDLAASHTVDLTTTPATVTATPTLVASLEPVDEKELRLRGPLVSVDTGASSYVIDVRPFHHRSARLGRVTVHTDANTSFEVNGVSLTGSDGLQALAAAGAGTQTVAFGTLTRSDHRFDARIVHAGTSVPGAGVDAVLGSVIARSGDELLVRGGTIVRDDDDEDGRDDKGELDDADDARFVRDQIRVVLGAGTQVFKDAVRPAVQLGAEAISVGQRIQAFGTARQENGEWVLDATQGRVRMHLTHLSGSVVQAAPGALNLDLVAIDGRRITAFDFTGTGQTPAQDADPADYEISTGLLGNAGLASGESARVFGFVTPFGAAPPDFEGRTVVDFRDLDAWLFIGWGREGTAAPFASADQAGLILDLQNPAIASRHHIRIGWQSLDLLTLPAAPQIVPSTSGRTVFVIVSRNSCLAFRDFAEFAAELGQRLNSTTMNDTTTIKSLTARGAYDRNTNVLTARSIIAIL